ncbi:Hypothetical predicted protein [Cloeon dipterum]|uniref:Ubiquitin carboxyl-terminal hydrolase n=1 Tax=Cloeon dipterum TaxID=197152 RepID=A0A8S1CEL7_9INSE|nr:Hypothetical predicted protein [Cloeon dipterum]
MSIAVEIVSSWLPFSVLALMLLVFIVGLVEGYRGGGGGPSRANCCGGGSKRGPKYQAAQTFQLAATGGAARLSGGAATTCYSAETRRISLGEVPPAPHPDLKLCSRVHEAPVRFVTMKMKNLKYLIMAPKQTYYVDQIESFKFKSQESLDSASSISSSSSTADDDYEEGSSSGLEGSPRLGRGKNERGGLVGLRNIGNTCFMNSVLQCLSNTRPLLEYILAEGYLSEINNSSSSMKGALIKAFGSLLQELWKGDSDERVVNTSSFKSQVQRFAPRFMGYAQQDAQEFLRYLLEGLHEDVNRVTTRPKPILTEIDDSLSDSQKAMEAWKRYLRRDDSKIVDIFVGQLKSTLQCTVCGHCSVTFDPFWDLSLPIPPSERYGQVRLAQCFDFFTKEEVLDGDEKPTCSRCQTRQKCLKSFSIHKFPRILVLHLKRFSPLERYRGKLSCTVDFPLQGLDLSAYASASKGSSLGQSCAYNLYGVANHSGTTYSGHYVAACKHPYSSTWHEYNDSRVSSTSARSVVSSEAYVLFYELASSNTNNSSSHL